MTTKGLSSNRKLIERVSLKVDTWLRANREKSVWPLWTNAPSDRPSKRRLPWSPVGWVLAGDRRSANGPLLAIVRYMSGDGNASVSSERGVGDGNTRVLFTVRWFDDDLYCEVMECSGQDEFTVLLQSIDRLA